MKLKKLLKQSVKAARNGKSPKLTTPVDFPAGAKMDREGNLILPKQPGACADLPYQLREARLALQHQAERFEKAESALRDYFIASLPKSSQTGCAGKLARVQIEVKPVPQAEDWEKVHSYIRDNDAWELLQRRLNESAVRERWEAEEQIPGVVVFNAKKVSVTKI